MTGSARFFGATRANIRFYREKLSLAANGLRKRKRRFVAESLGSEAARLQVARDLLRAAINDTAGSPPSVGCGFAAPTAASAAFRGSQRNSRSPARNKCCWGPERAANQSSRWHANKAGDTRVSEFCWLRRLDNYVAIGVSEEPPRESIFHLLSGPQSKRRRETFIVSESRQ